MQRLFALSLFALATGCGASFTFDYDVPEQAVQGSLLGNLLGPTLLDVPLEIDLQAQTEAHDTGPARHVYLSSLTLDLTTTEEPSGDADDFDFLDRVEIYVQGTTLPQVLVAVLDPAPSGERSLSITPQGVDLQPYIVEGADLSASAEGVEPPDDVTFTGHLVFEVEI